MNKGKIEYVEVVKGYKLNKKAVGCKWWELCDDCPYPDCIKGKKYVEPPKPASQRRADRQHAFEAYLNEGSKKHTGRE